MPQVSIVIPSYNHSLFLKDRLESIAKQTFKDWEAIIIDDNSTDNSVAIISKFITDNPNFKVKYFIVNETNSGSGYTSWQKGIELAETEYIWIAETDDYSSPEFLKEMINTLEGNTAALTFCESIYVNEKRDFLYDSSNRTSDLEVPLGTFKVISGAVYIEKMPFNTYITNGSSVIFRKPKKVIPQEIFSHKQCSDIFLWTYLLQENKFVFLNKKLNFFRRHEDSISHKIQSNNMLSIYYEQATYLNYFKQTKNSDIFVNHYLKYYILSNKAKFLNIGCLVKINNNKILLSYFFKLGVEVIRGLNRKAWKKINH